VTVARCPICGRRLRPSQELAAVGGGGLVGHFLAHAQCARASGIPEAPPVARGSDAALRAEARRELSRIVGREYPSPERLREAPGTAPGSAPERVGRVRVSIDCPVPDSRHGPL